MHLITKHFPLVSNLVLVAKLIMTEFPPISGRTVSQTNFCEDWTGKKSVCVWTATLQLYVYSYRAKCSANRPVKDIYNQPWNLRAPSYFQPKMRSYRYKAKWEITVWANTTEPGRAYVKLKTIKLIATHGHDLLHCDNTKFALYFCAFRVRLMDEGARRFHTAPIHFPYRAELHLHWPFQYGLQKRVMTTEAALCSSSQ